MKVKNLHSWNLTTKEAAQIQTQLASRVIKVGKPNQVKSVAGADLSSPDSKGMVTGAVVVLSYPELKILEVATSSGKPAMPYIPGFLSFRESPVILEAWEKLKTKPQLLIVDGQGVAHPRRFGVASHLGLWLDIPAIGCAKSVLVGKYSSLSGETGSAVPLMDKGEEVGKVVLTLKGHPPLYISIGHKISLEQAIHWILSLCRANRLPEPIRLAHLAASGHLTGNETSA